MLHLISHRFYLILLSIALTTSPLFANENGSGGSAPSSAATARLVRAQSYPAIFDRHLVHPDDRRNIVAAEGLPTDSELADIMEPPGSSGSNQSKAKNAVRHLVERRDLDGYQKALLWESFANLLDNFTSIYHETSDGSFLFVGPGSSLLIKRDGEIYRGDGFFVREGEVWQTNYGRFKHRIVIDYPQFAKNAIDAFKRGDVLGAETSEEFEHLLEAVSNTEGLQKADEHEKAIRGLIDYMKATKRRSADFSHRVAYTMMMYWVDDVAFFKTFIEAAVLVSEFATARERGSLRANLDIILSMYEGADSADAKNIIKLATQAKLKFTLVQVCNEKLTKPTSGKGKGKAKSAGAKKKR